MLPVVYCTAELHHPVLMVRLTKYGASAGKQSRVDLQNNSNADHKLQMLSYKNPLPNYTSCGTLFASVN